MKLRLLLGSLAALTLVAVAGAPAQAHNRYVRYERYERYDPCYDRDRYYDRGYYYSRYDPYYDRGYYRDRYYDRDYYRPRTSISIGFRFDLGGRRHRRYRW